MFILRHILTMDSADSIPESAWSIMSTLAEVPLWMWGAVGVTGVLGIPVLVFPFSLSHLNVLLDNSYPITRLTA